jgi:hypothetical protein
MFIRVEGGGPALPQVTILATDSSASEELLDPGEFTITRTGDTSEALLVNYTVTGSATTAVDYVSLSGSITILAGDSSAIINVALLQDTDSEPDETVILTIDAVADVYTVGAQNSDTVTIADNDGGVPPSEDLFFATTETTLAGTVTGSLSDTLTSDNVYEGIKEKHSGGKPSSRISFLDHRWTFDGIGAVGGDTLTFSVEAYHTSNLEGDDFEFSWSTDLNGLYLDFLTISKTSDDDMSSSQHTVVAVNEILSVGEPIEEQTEDDEAEESTLSQPDPSTSSAFSDQIDSVLAELLEEGIVPML